MNKFNEPIDDEFEKAYLFFQQGKFILDESFKKAFFDFLDKHKEDHYSVHDSIFENFGPFWYNVGPTGIILKPLQQVELVLDKILSLVHEWEDKNQPHKIHKGTPYYFYGMISILKRDIDKGLLLMHQASNEDDNLGRTDTPSKNFISLNDQNPFQLFRSKVIETVSFLNDYISDYNDVNKANFNINNLRSKFLEKEEYKEEAFFFIYCIYKLEKIINYLDKRIKNNKLASHINTAIIFNLCKIFEVLLSNLFDDNLAKKIDKLCQDPVINLTLRQNMFGILNVERDKDNNFKVIIEGLLNNSYTHQQFSGNYSPIEFDLSLVYALRNFGGHKIEDQEFVREKFEDIIKAILRAIFFVIDKKY